jgi:serine/threonine protein kinase
MFTHEGQEQGDRFYVVTELAPNGELFGLVSEAEGLNGSKLKYCRALFSQISEGVNHLHDKGIAHRDLKLENCFLDKDCNIKVADFGLMKIFGEPGQVLKTHIGTLNYMAPEMYSENEYTESVDIFAMGVMLFMMLTC